MGGFESATMVFASGRRVDAIAGANHDRFAEKDYDLLARHGIRTVRDALRWHRIERRPGRYDWSSFLPMLRAANRADVEVIWDLCHFGLPDDVDPWSGDLVDRFAHFAAAAARVVAEECGHAPVWCPVNEMSFWAFAAGDRKDFAPFGNGRGREWKRQLVRLAVAGGRAVRGVDPRARLMHIDPVIHIVPDHATAPGKAEEGRLSMFEAWDMIAGRRDPDLGGSPDLLDIVGVNFYANNEWVDHGRVLAPGDPSYRPLRDILGEVFARYGRPIVVAETGTEGPAGVAWLRAVCDEARVARESGVPVEGLCVYPIMDYPGWTDDRHCRCGLIEVSGDWTDRRVNAAMADAVGSARRAFPAH